MPPDVIIIPPPQIPFLRSHRTMKTLVHLRTDKRIATRRLGITEMKLPDTQAIRRATGNEKESQTR